MYEHDPADHLPHKSGPRLALGNRQPRVTTRTTKDCRMKTASPSASSPSASSPSTPLPKKLHPSLHRPSRRMSRRRPSPAAKLLSIKKSDLYHSKSSSDQPQKTQKNAERLISKALIAHFCALCAFCGQLPFSSSCLRVIQDEKIGDVERRLFVF